MRNDFYGWQVGTRADGRLGDFEGPARPRSWRWATCTQVENLNGFAVTNFFNAPAGGPFTGVPTQIVPGSGAFVQPSNQGRISRDDIAVAPEVERDARLSAH